VKYIFYRISAIHCWPNPENPTKHTAHYQQIAVKIISTIQLKSSPLPPEAVVGARACGRY
jgi:hypothetical protein